MTAIEVRDDGTAVSFLPSESTFAQTWKLATGIANTEFVPGSLRGKPEAILAAMLTGREVGIGAMHALRAIDVIDGRPSLSPELLHAMALKAGHDVDVEEATRTGCTVAIRRSNWPQDRVRRVTFDEVDARLAGLVGDKCSPSTGEHVNDRTTRSGNPTCGCKQGYRTYPRAMYRARAVAEGARSHLPDVVERMGYTAEEFGGAMARHEDAMGTVDVVAPDPADATEAAWDVGAEADTTNDDPPPDDGDVVDAVVVPDGDDGDDTPAGAPADGDDAPDAPADDTATSAPQKEQAPEAPAVDTAQAGDGTITLVAAYPHLNVADVSQIIRSGETTTTINGAEVRVTGTPHEVYEQEAAQDTFRKTVRAALEAVGYRNSAMDAPADDPAPSGPPESPEERASARAEYNRLYKAVYAVDDKSFASRLHAKRIELLGGPEPERFDDAPAGAIVALLDEALSIHAESEVPF